MMSASSAPIRQPQPLSQHHLPGDSLGFQEASLSPSSLPPSAQIPSYAYAPPPASVQLQDFRDATKEIVALIEAQESRKAGELIEQNLYNPCVLIPQLEQTKEWDGLVFIAVKSPSPVVKGEVGHRLLRHFLATQDSALLGHLRFLVEKGSGHISTRLLEVLGTTFNPAKFPEYLSVLRNLGLAASLGALEEALSSYSQWKPDLLPQLYKFVHATYPSQHMEPFVHLFQHVLCEQRERVGVELLAQGVARLLVHLGEQFAPDSAEVEAVLVGLASALPWEAGTTETHLSLLRHPRAGPRVAAQWNSGTLTKALTHVGSAEQLDEFCALVPRMLELSLLMTEPVTNTNPAFSILPSHCLGRFRQAGILFLLRKHLPKK